MRAPLNTRLPDQDTDRAVQDLRERFAEVRSLPAFGARIIRDVELKDGIATPVAHRLGRRHQHVNPSPPRGATSTGRITEVRDGSADPEKFVVLKADGWGATITVDVEVK